MNKKVLTVAIAGAMAAPMTAQAVKYKLSGQVNRAVVFMDDGYRSDVRNVDAITSGTRWRLRGSEDLGNGMKVGFYYEMQTSSAPSSAAYPNQNTDGNNGVSSGGNIRQANVWFSGNWGKLSIGQLDGAGNGAAESDLSGTAIAGTYSGRTSFTGGISWRTSNGAAFVSTAGGSPATSATTTAQGLTAGSTYSNYDSFSRYDGVRYDSPALGPVTISASVGNDSKWEVAGRVDTALFGGQLSGALFYGEATGALNIDSRYGGSLSYLFAQGTSITGHYTVSEPQVNAAPEGTSWGVKLGHKWGPNAVSVQYGEATNVPGALLIGAGVNGTQAETTDSGFSVGYVRSLKKANTEVYASYMFQSLDHNIYNQNTNTQLPDAEDINVVVVGARVKFD